MASDDKSLIVHVNKVYNLPLLHPILKKTFPHSLEEECLALSSYGGDATIPSEHDGLKSFLTKGHMFRLDTALYPTEKMSWCFYILFINSANHIKTNYNYEVKLQKHNITYDIKKNLWTTSALSMEKVQIRCLQKTY